MPYAVHDSETHFSDLIGCGHEKYPVDVDLCDLMQTMKLDASCEKGIEQCRRYTSSRGALSTKRPRRSHVRISESRRGVAMHRASAFKHESRAVLRLRLSASNPISVRGLSDYRRGVSRCHFHSSRNLPRLPRHASRLRTRFQRHSLPTGEESVEIRPGGRYRGSDGVPT